MELINGLKKYSLLGVAGLSLAGALISCDDDVLGSILGSGDTISALKEALTIGAKTAATTLGEKDGYLMDELVKIGVPEETQAIFELAKTDAGKTFLSAVDAKAFDEESMVELMNRAAEKAAPESAQIFANAITSMTISDGEEILFGADNAATTYLHDKTYAGLQSTFGDVVTGTFDQVSVSGKTLNDAWDAFSTNYNKLVDYKNTKAGSTTLIAAQTALTLSGKKNLAEKIAKIESVNTNLGEYVTGKALDGLFVKVEDKEKDIRTNVAARTSELLQKVFGRLDTEK